MGSYSVERSITVKAPASRVHDLVNDFHHWTGWSPWEDLDPDLQRTYTGPDATGKTVTNKRISGRGASFLDVENGKIARFTDYYDLGSYFR